MTLAVSQLSLMGSHDCTTTTTENGNALDAEWDLLKRAFHPSSN